MTESLSPRLDPPVLTPCRRALPLIFCLLWGCGWGCEADRAAPAGVQERPASAASRGPSEGSAERRVRAAHKTAAEAYTVPERTVAELATELRAACEEVRGRARILLEFSAPWCRACARLEEMKAEPALARALGRTRTTRINVGHFDRHADLISAFGVRGLPHWELLEPGTCDAPAWSWRRLGQRTLEPVAGQQGATATELAAWLEAREPT